MQQGQFGAEFSLHLLFIIFPYFLKFPSVSMNMQLYNKIAYQTIPSDESTISKL